MPDSADAPAVDRHTAAADFLESLPCPWCVGPVAANRLAPLLLDQADAGGWQLDERLRAKLTGGHTKGIRNAPAALAARIRRIGEAPERPPATPCSKCGSTTSSVHGRGPWPLCVRCTVGDAPAPAGGDVSARVDELRAVLRSSRRRPAHQPAGTAVRPPAGL